MRWLEIVAFALFLSTSGCSEEDRNTGTGGAGPGCPDPIPADGSSCVVEGASCDYGSDCCPVVAKCEGGTWSVPDVSCASPSCPAAQPTDGAACNPCVNGPVCSYDLCASGGAYVTAVCADTTWAITEGGCGTYPCGDPGAGQVFCKQAELCVETAGGAGFQYTCAPNPCGSVQVTCACASSVCGTGLACTSATAQLIQCACSPGPCA